MDRLLFDAERFIAVFGGDFAQILPQLLLAFYGSENSVQKLNSSHDLSNEANNQ